MRKSLINALMKYKDNPEFCVLTGDLGWGVLEPLQEALGERFINAGIAEQNMISVAAGLAQEGMRPFVYSISPFIYARAFEQIRNDICIHNLSVCLIGSGAGYGYGNSGPTHHAIEDYGVISSLQNIKVFVPSFSSDMPGLVEQIMNLRQPVYIRLGRDELNVNHDDFKIHEFESYRKLKSGSSGVILVIGNMAGTVINFLKDDKNFAVWSCGLLPVKINDIPVDMLDEIRASGRLIIIEDHAAASGLSSQFAACILEAGITPLKFARFYAQGYENDLYGSQDYYREHNGLSINAIKNKLDEFTR